MGDNSGAWGDTAATVVDIQITSTRSIFVMQAGPMNLTVTFLSPIEPSDWVKQSIPFSYVSVDAHSLDGAGHDVQMYSDITSEFVTGIRPSGNDGGDPVRWQNNRGAQALYHETEPETLRAYTEIGEQAQDGKGYFAMALSSNPTWQIDTDSNCRHGFADFGKLNNTEETAYGPMGKPWYVFAIAVDLGKIDSTASPVTWAIGYVRDPVVPYTTPSGATDVRRPYWTTRFSDVSALIDAFVADYPAAHDRAVKLDERIMGDAAQVSSQYVDLVSLVTRQVMGSLDITVLGGSGNDVDSTDVKAFMKAIGSTQTRVNPVELMFAAFPTYLYLNASLGGALLAPLLLSQDSLSGQAYAAQDIGSSYPNATGTRGAHQQGIEESGNMLIMMYAHARVSGDGSLLDLHYDTAKRWADYLVNTTLTPLNQLSANGLNNPNMTNLAIKGIIGVKAMAEISRTMTPMLDNMIHAKSLISSWLSLAQSSDQSHLLGMYADQSSSAMMYNIYADLLLGTNLIPQDILTKQTQYYKTLLQKEAAPFGLYVDKVLANTASTAWTMFTAATTTDTGVRDQFIESVWNRASSNKTAGALPDIYDDTTGASSSNGGGAGPALGSIFAPLALNVQNTTIVVPPRSAGDGNDSGSSKTPVGAIAGGVVGGVVLVAALGLGIFFWRRRRQQRASSEYHYKEDLLQQPEPYPYAAAYQQESSNLTSYAASNANTRRDENRSTDDPVTRGTSGDTPHTSSYPLVPSSKAQEHAREMEQRSLLSPFESPSGPSMPLPRTSSNDMQSPGAESATGNARSGANTTELLGLRAEVENLKRVVHVIREERLDPPPQYADEF